MVASLHHTISSHTSDVNGVSFSADRKLATCSGDKTVRLWDIDDYAELPCSPLCGHSYYVHCCTFSPFGTLLATCSTDGKIIVWDPKSGTKKGTLQHDSRSPVRVCRFSPNSSMIVSGGDDNCMCLWDVSRMKLIRYNTDKTELQIFFSRLVGRSDPWSKKWWVISGLTLAQNLL